MSNEDDQTWVFDSLVCFLHGPVWSAPLQTFIEQKSLIFDPNLQPDEHNSEYRKIHDEYKNLVDYMLGSFMEEMQITPEQFEMACLEGRHQHSENPFNFHQGLFQQIWAANDIKIFVRMMTQRNVELQLQALDLIEKNQLAALQEGVLVDSESPTADRKEHIDDSSGITLTEGEEESIVESTKKELDSPEAIITPDKPTETEVTDKFERLNLFFEKNQQISPDDIQLRQEYLRQQRDKILEIKRKTRARQLNETAQSSESLDGRPTSAQVARKLLEGGEASKEVLAAVSSNSAASSASLQLRKTLAKRLRAEVVEHQ